MEQFIVNIIHRPEMVPEYSEKVTGQGKAEDLGREALLTESLDIFKIQQECAHKNGLKTTIQMTYASLFNEEAVALAKEHHESCGDEISMECEGPGKCGYVREGYAFSPMFTLGYTGKLHEKEVFTTWLRLERAG